MVDCPVCCGQRRVHWDLGFGAHWQPCPHCEGCGQIDADAGLDEYPVEVVAVVLVECADCLGRGWKEAYRSGRLSDWTPGTCNSCRGSGSVLRAAA